MPLYLTLSVREKLKGKHGVTEDEVVECFANRDRGSLIDTREQHQTVPPTRWFIAQTNYGRLLKICYVPDEKTGITEIKTAYEPNDEEKRIFEKYAAHF